MARKSYLVSAFLLIIFISLMICTTDSSSITTRLSAIGVKPKPLPIAKLIIPKIRLDGNLYNKNSSLNDVDKNIEILDGSILPNIIFLAGHSGNASNAYFNDLDKLKIGDEIIFQYNKYNYFYNVDKIIEQDRDGDIELNKSSDNQLVLTTCSKKSIKKQLIINSNLIKKEEIN